MARPATIKSNAPADEATPAPAPAPQSDIPDNFVKVETTGGFGLVDIVTGYEIGHDGPSVVPNSPFVRERIEMGQLRFVK